MPDTEPTSPQDNHEFDAAAELQRLMDAVDSLATSPMHNVDPSSRTGRYHGEPDRDAIEMVAASRYDHNVVRLVGGDQPPIRRIYTYFHNNVERGTLGYEIADAGIAYFCNGEKSGMQKDVVNPDPEKQRQCIESASGMLKQLEDEIAAEQENATGSNTELPPARRGILGRLADKLANLTR